MHLVLEDAPAPPIGPPSDLPVLLPLSARSADGVNNFAERIAARLNDDPALDIQDVAFTLQTARTALAFRRSVVARDRQELIEALTQIANVSAPAEQTCAPVLLFPGQGAQRAGMARALHAAFPLFRSTVDDCCEIATTLGVDLRRHVLAERGRNRPAAAPPWMKLSSRGAAATRRSRGGFALQDQESAAALRRTALAQPALFAVELAMARLLESWGLAPAAVLGHSVGEFAAACHAGVFSMEDGMRLVCARGRLIQSLPPAGCWRSASPRSPYSPISPAKSIWRQ